VFYFCIRAGFLIGHCAVESASQQTRLQSYLITFILPIPAIIKFMLKCLSRGVEGYCVG
jgi:hypothetical protein